ncbi:MAG: membrane protein required for beta-lactamase induction [Gammaproteobacteria bacterium]|jgi:membrane protein required for beta-lactamase induction
MILIVILIALSLDFFLGGLERFRNFNWCISLYYRLEKRLAQYKFWDGTFGLLLVLSVALSALIIVLCLASSLPWIVEIVVSLIVLIYCLAPEDLDNRLDKYITAVDEGNVAAVTESAEGLIDETLLSEDDSNEIAIIKSSLVESHKRTFAVIFWFLILGAVGALLYRLVNELSDEFSEIRSGFADSTSILINILEWPSSRLMVLGLALGGHLVDAMPGWSKAEHLSIEVNNEVLTDAGIGALQYRTDIEVPDREKSYWVDELKGLLNRTLIIWLAILGLMTLSGTLG